MRRLSEPDQGAWIPQYIWELASLWAVLCINTPTLQQLRLTGLLLFVVVKSIVRHKKDLELMLRLEDTIAPLCNLCFCTEVNRESLFKDSCLPQNSSSITKLWYFGPRAKSLHVWSPFVTFNYWKRTSENTFTRACSSKTKSTWVKCKKKKDIGFQDIPLLKPRKWQKSWFERFCLIVEASQAQGEHWKKA